MATRRTALLGDQRGVALPLALMVLILLAALTAALAGLSTTEPLISTNLKLSDQALALAEAGVERAVWVLSPAPTGPTGQGLATPLTAAAPAPWDGSTLFRLTAAGDSTVAGGYTVRLLPGARPSEVQVTSAGWIPDNLNPTASRVIRTTLMSLNLRFRPPGALSVNGEANVSGNAAIAASGNVCHTTRAASGSYSAGRTDVGGSAQICAGASCSTSKTNCQSPGCLQNQPDAATTFQELRLTPEELAILKDLAKASRTYWGPPNYAGSATAAWNGSVNFNTANPLPNGIVFVDTKSGAPPSSSRLSDLADVRISGSGTWSGWLIIMGSVDVSGNGTYNGLIYVVDDLTAGNGTAAINGAIVAHNLNNSNGTQIDTSANGTISISYSCPALNTGGGTIPQGFMVKPGTWREVSG
jgi:hypothetical protein